jgi:small subunit ribosomal protein S6
MAVARDYELGIIVNPDVGDEQTRAIVARITQTIAANEGQVVRVNAQGRRRLAYPIEHHRDGMYFYFDMVLPPQAVTELERTLRVNEDVIRHLVLVRDPRAVAQQRQREAEADAQAAAQAAQAARPAAAEPAPEVEPVLAEEVTQPAAEEPAAEEPAAEEPAAEEDEAASEGTEDNEADEGAEAETTDTEAEANA